MNRRKFIYQTSGLALTAMAAPAFAKFAPAKDKMDRIAMGTLLFRSQFKQTAPKGVTTIKDELTVMDVAQHHRDKFGVKKIEFWSEHIESFDEGYLTDLKNKIKAAGSELVDVQFDSTPFDKTGYDLASLDEDKRRAGVAHVKKWMDAASFLGTKCVRVNPGTTKGSIYQSIQSFKELVPYARKKNLTIITANHFGIETDADKHVAIVTGAPGIYTEPDFGNYNGAPDMYESLGKIIPLAYIVSAKTSNFVKVDGKLTHPQYDFDKCVQLSESLGFRRNYMVAQWGNIPADISNDEIAAWTIERLKANMR
jgi:hypothetical protein